MNSDKAEHAVRMDVGEEAPPEKSRLSVIPFAVLLPTVGDLAELEQFRVFFEKRSQEIRSLTLASTGEVSKELACEGSMLNQVLQWFRLGRGEEK